MLSITTRLRKTGGNNGGYVEAFCDLTRSRYIMPTDPEFRSRGSLPDVWTPESVQAFLSGCGGRLWVGAGAAKGAFALTWGWRAADPDKPICYFHVADPSWSKWCDREQKIQIGSKVYAAMTPSSSDENDHDLCVEAIISDGTPGAARALLKEIMQYASAQNYETVHSEIAISPAINKPSVRLFSSLGFKEDEAGYEDNVSRMYKDSRAKITWRRWTLDLTA